MFFADDFKKEPQKSQSKNRENLANVFGKVCGYVEKDLCIKSFDFGPHQANFKCEGRDINDGNLSLLCCL